MSMLDGYTTGLALGKMLTDKEFAKEAETLRMRLKIAQENAAVEHATHLGMIDTANAVVSEVKAIAAGVMKPAERRLSDPNNSLHLNIHFRDASDEAERRISGGKLKLEFSGKPGPLPPALMPQVITPTIVPVDPKPRPR